MVVGIVGHEGKKFTDATEAEAKRVIEAIIRDPACSAVCSGRCHLGGVDIWAEEIAARVGVRTIIYPPSSRDWATGYRPRNLKIAAMSDIVHCIVVASLPDDYDGMRFPLCYHCGTRDHVKSGGCWTAKRCKQQRWHIVGERR